MDVNMSVSRLASFVLGAMFIVSGLGKMMDAAAFGELISSYGFDWFSILSPVIIVAELFLGGYLVCGGGACRVCALLSAVLLVIFTSAFAYANIVHGIEDCGCYGHIGASIPVWATYLRNVVLLALAVYVWRVGKCRPRNTANCKYKLVLLAGFLTVCVFWTGHTWMPSTFYVNKFARPHRLIGVDVNSSPLGQYVQVSKDSTYIIWVFSYSCNGCINSVENIKQYQTGVADHFIPLTVTEDKDGRARELLDIDFVPKEVGNGLTDFIRIVPTFLYVEEGKIKYVIEHTVPNVYTFKSIYLEMSNDEILLTKEKADL
jgi:uncharacterized membrane protein YphA (DoxX/SURF4 family)